MFMEMPDINFLAMHKRDRLFFFTIRRKPINTNPTLILLLFYTDQLSGKINSAS